MSEKPVVLNRLKCGIPDGAVFVGRPTKWGNPYLIGRHGSRHAVVMKYKRLLLRSPDLMAALPELKGKDLVCFCAPLPCHADVLLELANNGGG